MKKFVALLIVIGGVVVLMGSLRSHTPDGLTEGETTLTLQSPEGEEISLFVEVADDETERSRGLMGRKELADGHGMLFYFREPESHIVKPKILSFWMKNTLIPLDIIFMDERGIVVSAASMEPCTEDPCPLTSSVLPASFALEVPAGFLRQYGVERGWEMTWHMPENDGQKDSEY